jgi:hypothetical protein
LLAHHAINGGLDERALGYLARTAERARRVAAHREAAALLEQAVTIAERSGRPDLVPDFRARRGRELMRSGRHDRGQWIAGCWLPVQDEMAALSTRAVHLVVPDATHASLIEDETSAMQPSPARRS